MPQCCVFLCVCAACGRRGSANLEKTLGELGVVDGDEISIADPRLMEPLMGIIVFGGK